MNRRGRWALGAAAMLITLTAHSSDTSGAFSPRSKDSDYTFADNSHLHLNADTPIDKRHASVITLAESRFEPWCYQYASSNPSSNPRELTSTGAYLYFAANDIQHGNELWRTDGTRDGTVLVKDIFPGSASSNPSELTAMGKLVYFRAEDGISGYELWRSDGTALGTTLVMNIYPGGNARPKHLTALKNKLLFSAYRPYDGEELWVLEPGREPRILANIAPDNASSSPDNFVVWRNHVYFRADDGVHGRELWRTDGTAEGTGMVRDVVNAPFEHMSLANPGNQSRPRYFSNNVGGVEAQFEHATRHRSSSAFRAVERQGPRWTRLCRDGECSVPGANSRPQVPCKIAINF